MTAPRRHKEGCGGATTPSYDARARGVFSALDLMKAARLAPDAFPRPDNLGGAYSIIA